MREKPYFNMTDIDVVLGKSILAPHSKVFLASLNHLKNKEYDMFKPREKVKSTLFSEFVRNSSAKDKRKFFNKVIKETVAVQRAMIEQSKNCN
jgi:uncharacterized FlgJ-related protein